MGAPSPGTAAFVFGWGIQQPTDKSAVVTKLMGIILETVKCPPDGKSDAMCSDEKSGAKGQAKYICVRQPADIGGACDGDSGG